MNLKERALKLHEDNKGKISLKCRVPVKNREDLTLAYTPGVAEPCLLIKENEEDIYKYTSKGNQVGVITNGTAVLGLGNIGPSASLPVMEGKCVLFKSFGAVDAYPLCLNTEDPYKFIEAVKLLEPSFGGINLEDIKAPECFIIEDELKKHLNIPVFHDDQHGTAIVSLAALINSTKLVNKNFSDITIVINGAGAAGVAITKLLLKIGAKDIIVCDSKGIIDENRADEYKRELSKITNRKKISGSLSDALVGADVFIGVSAPNCVTSEMISKMNSQSIVMPMANPVPEIYPEEAKRGGAKIICTGRSDFPNQVNNVLAFPGIFRGALDVRASEINDDMKIAAANAIASLVGESELNEEFVIPDAFDLRIAPTVAKYVSQAAIKTKVARLNISPEYIEKNTIKLLNELE